MRRIILILAVIQFVFFNFQAHSAEIEKKEEIRKTLYFSDPNGKKQIVVDNVFGSITVIGVKEEAVQLTVHKAIRAKSEAKVEAAQEEVGLEISEKNNCIEFFVDGPFRCKRRSVNYRGWRYYGYKVSHDFELKVPFETEISLKTVNEGQISVRKISGNYDVENINGGIDMREIAGSGRVYALNGNVDIIFEKNPESDSYFGSLNGEIKVFFRSPLSADFRLKTFNGEVYSDFEVSYLSPRAFTKVKRNGKNVYKCDSTFGVRTGNGGPEIELDAFNGDIYILERKD